MREGSTLLEREGRGGGRGTLGGEGEGRKEEGWGC